jgi:hypothetical protein
MPAAVAASRGGSVPYSSGRPFPIPEMTSEANVTTCHLDYETYSDVDLRKQGLDSYSHACEVLMVAYSFDDGPILHWTLDNGPFPRELADALADPHVIKWGFNSQFERTITRRALRIKTPLASWRCTQTLAYMLSFSGGLGDVGAQVGLPVRTSRRTSRAATSSACSACRTG